MEMGNDIDILLRNIPFMSQKDYDMGNKCNSCYEFAFAFNQSVVQSTKSTSRHYLQVLSIVGQALMKVINEENPNMIQLKPTDKSGKNGQKFNIYNNILNQHSSDLKSMGYSIRNDGINLFIERTNQEQINEESNKKVNYEIEHMGSVYNRDSYELGMYIDGNIVGMVQYVIFEGELTVSNIIVPPKYRRLGYGSMMMQYLKEYHPEAKYKPSFKTDDGMKFNHKQHANLTSVRQ